MLQARVRVFLAFIALFLGFSAPFQASAQSTCFDIFSQASQDPIFKRIDMDSRFLKEEEAESEALQDKKVAYLETPEERAPYEWQISHGLFVKKISGEWQPFNTADTPKATGSVEFVASTRGQMYGFTRSEQSAVAAYYDAAVHHSTFLAGGSVGFAGHIKILNGKVEELQNFSGHYMTPISSMLDFLDFLTSRGVDLSLTRIHFVDMTDMMKKNRHLHERALKYAPEQRLLEEQNSTRHGMSYSPANKKIFEEIRKKVEAEYPKLGYSPTLFRTLLIWSEIRSPEIKDFLRALASSHGIQTPID